jgi:uncharacterized damage-inducible protein DinB
MNAKDAIKTALASSQHLLNWFLGDLSDADLLVRPAPGANHIAWQVGHLIVAERMFGKSLPGAVYPELPAKFVEHHGKETAAVEPPTGFGTKNDYLSLFNKGREVTVAALGSLSEADLDKPTEGNIAKFAPTLGALLLLAASHTTMHTGQFSVVRRKLGKPVLF